MTPEQELSMEKMKEDMGKLTPEKFFEKYAPMMEKLEQAEALSKKAEQQEAELEKLKKENWELRYDSLTGLEVRRIYFQKLNQRVETLLEDPSYAEILEKDELSSEDMERIDNVHLSVVSADLAYLSKYNDDPEIKAGVGGGHKGGDIILEKTAQLIQKIDYDTQKVTPSLNPETVGYRLGGDEFGMIVEQPMERAEEIAQEFKIKQSTIEIPGADVPPSINLGTAHVREGVEVFMKAYNKEERGEMPLEEKAKKVQELLTEVADRRASVAKGRERLFSMVDLLGESPDKFDRNFKWMQKGAFGLEKSEFVKLLEMKQKDPDNFAEYVDQMVHELLERQHQEAVKKQAKEYSVITEIADRKFKGKK